MLETARVLIERGTDLNAADTMRLTIPSVTAIIFGMQTVFASFFLSALLLGRRAPEDRS